MMIQNLDSSEYNCFRNFTSNELKSESFGNKSQAFFTVKLYFFIFVSFLLVPNKRNTKEEKGIILKLLYVM